jgi:hypothetical protein
MGRKMPNNEHVAVLSRGVAAWNAWRAENDETPDSPERDMAGLDC